jgi:hypothetical protein
MECGGRRRGGRGVEEGRGSREAGKGGGGGAGEEPMRGVYGTGSVTWDVAVCGLRSFSPCPYGLRWSVVDWL